MVLMGSLRASVGISAAVRETVLSDGERGVNAFLFYLFMRVMVAPGLRGR
jgi:hypothetical protein